MVERGRFRILPSIPRMPKDSELPAIPAETLTKVLRHALVEAADLQDLEERVKEISDKNQLGHEAPPVSESLPIA